MKVNNLQQEILKIIPYAFHDIINKLDETSIEYLIRRDGINDLIKYYLDKYLIENIVNSDNIKYEWVGAALFYRYYLNQYHNAIAVMDILYNLMIKYQINNKIWIHKGLPLYFLRDFYILLNCPVIAKRYAMLTLCEDSIGDKITKGHLRKNEGEIYSRLTFYHGMTHKEIDDYYLKINEIYDDSEYSRFPEWILQKLDKNWMTDYPTNNEMMRYIPNISYINKLIDNLDDDKNGNKLEILAEYILSIIPGIKTKRRVKSISTDYDILFSIEGPNIDFRSELGRYIICECKNWRNKADFTTISKFSNTLESTKCIFGILFSKNGITGNKNNTDAQREILKTYQRNGINIIVLTLSDIKQVQKGSNLITIIREKYEQNRFDFK